MLTGAGGQINKKVPAFLRLRMAQLPAEVRFGKPFDDYGEAWQRNRWRAPFSYKSEYYSVRRCARKENENGELATCQRALEGDGSP